MCLLNILTSHLLPPPPPSTALAITLWGQQRRHHNFFYRSSDTRWAVALTDPNTCETEARRHTDQPSELSWIYYRDKLLLSSPVSAATILRVSEDLERDFIILVITVAAFSWPCSGFGEGGWGGGCQKSGGPPVAQQEPDMSLKLQADESSGLWLSW